ncbi:MAG: hypothetical protein JO244_02080 [Solirubrobacterales bacterium]|nr:hypothetical protein [Solirubrobacterales bacterium]
MRERLSAAEVGQEIAEHSEHTDPSSSDPRDRSISIVEAVVLSLVAVLAAYSGFAAAKWETRSSISLARASAFRTKAAGADLSAASTRTFDSVSFNAWFSAFVAGNPRLETLAVRRFRPGYLVAFNAWLATDPAHNPHSPPGPAYMPQYVIPQQQVANDDGHAADVAFTTGENAGATSDDYVRDTVFLASVLFLVGIGAHFRLRAARYGLLIVGLGLLGFAVSQLLGLPGPP